jgi:subfamily B ATP-binding cassette protein MsbA
MSKFPTSIREDTGIKGFTQLIRPWNTYLVLIILLVGGLALADMALPFALSLLIDDVFPSLIEKSTDSGGWTTLLILLLSLCAIYVLRNALFFISRMLCVKVSEEVSFNLRQRLFDHLQQLGMSFYKTNQPGQISSRVMDDTYRIQIFVQEKLPTLLRYTIEFLILMVLLYTVNWKLAVASTVVLPLHLWTYKKFYKPIRDSHHRAQKHLADAHGNLIETFLGAQVIKGFSAERRESESFLKTIRAGRDTQIRTQRIQFSQKVIADLLVGVGTVFLIGYGAWEVSQGPTVMKIGSFLMFFWYVRMLYPAVLEIISGMGHFSKTSASLDRVFEMLDEPVTDFIHDMRTRNQALHFEGSIVFANVSLVFGDQTEVLRNINLVIPEGQHLVITGPSGSGKARLLAYYQGLRRRQLGLLALEESILVPSGSTMSEACLALRSKMRFCSMHPSLRTYAMHGQTPPRKKSLMLVNSRGQIASFRSFQMDMKHYLAIKVANCPTGKNRGLIWQERLFENLKR